MRFRRKLRGFDEDHTSAAAAQGRLSADEAVAPSLWWFEVGNTLIVTQCRGRLTEVDTSTFLRESSRSSGRIDRTLDEAAVLFLTPQHRLTVYDAIDVELARGETFSPATLDRDLRKAADGLGVALIDAED